jgi:hypothetical protein
MNFKIAVWAATALAALQYVVHTVLFLSAKPTHGDEEVQLISAMKAYRFSVGSFERSYWDFYYGYGLMAILLGIVEIGILWQVARLAATDVAAGARIVAVLLLLNLGHALIAWNYFFLAPLAFDLAVAACLVWALLAYPRHKRA